MRYAGVNYNDMSAAPGVSVSVFLQGCPHHCKGCHNPETWNFEGGKAFTKKEEDALITLINKPHIAGFTLLGGEPMEKENREDVLKLLKRIKEECPGKTVWLYSSFLYEEICQFEENILDYVDVLVDGMFILAKKDAKLRFRGSSNQRLIDIAKTREQGQIVLFE